MERQARAAARGEPPGSPGNPRRLRSAATGRRPPDHGQAREIDRVPCIARRLLRGVFVAVWATTAGLATSAASAQERISAAETLLFQTDHLKNVAPPATLSYAFAKTGSAESGFDDTVKLRVRSV